MENMNNQKREENVRFQAGAVLLQSNLLVLLQITVSGGTTQD
jgi:hypothetical protein